MGAELGILVASPARLDEALARIERPEATQIFLMDEGVRAMSDPRLRALLDEGAEISLCAMDAEARGVFPVEGGVRFGSQYDHAQMIRDAARIVTLTGAKIDESRPFSERRRVGIAIVSSARDRESAQALRSAVGYLGCDLEVAILLSPGSRALVHDDHPPEVARHLATLRGLGVRFYDERDERPRFDVQVTW